MVIKEAGAKAADAPGKVLGWWRGGASQPLILSVRKAMVAVLKEVGDAKLCGELVQKVFVVIEHILCHFWVGSEGGEVCAEKIIWKYM